LYYITSNKTQDSQSNPSLSMTNSETNGVECRNKNEKPCMAVRTTRSGEEAVMAQASQLANSRQQGRNEADTIKNQGVGNQGADGLVDQYLFPTLIS
jgi:hypothetical protein